MRFSPRVIKLSTLISCSLSWNFRKFSIKVYFPEPGKPITPTVTGFSLKSSLSLTVSRYFLQYLMRVSIPNDLFLFSGVPLTIGTTGYSAPKY